MGFFDKDDKPKVISPIEFISPGQKVQENPISFMDNNINGESNFAILKTTDGGKWVRGNMLFYSLNGVEIYTELNNIIFVDTVNNNLFIRDYSKVIEGIAPTDPEQKEYIILYTDLGYEDGDKDFPLRWESVTGRLTCYETIKASLGIIDIDKSIVLVENVTVKDSLTIRQFISYLQNADMVDKNEINLDDYLDSDYY